MTPPEPTTAEARAILAALPDKDLRALIAAHRAHARMHTPATINPNGPPRGRPPLPAPKHLVSLRLDPSVIAGFRASGPGWQSRINAVLRENLPPPNLTLS
jgi:uncharacterized protein (DUF4415 family)